MRSQAGRFADGRLDKGSHSLPTQRPVSAVRGRDALFAVRLSLSQKHVSRQRALRQSTKASKSRRHHRRAGTAGFNREEI